MKTLLILLAAIGTVTNEIPTAQTAAVILEVAGAGKLVKAAGKEVSEVAVKTAVNAKSTLDEALQRGWDGRLGEYVYNKADGTFTGTGGGKLINTGQKDPITGDYVYQRMNADGKPYDNYLTINMDGKQVGVNKPEVFKLSEQVELPSDGLYNRSYLRTETMNSILSNYEKLPNGGYRNITTREIIEGPIDIGHAYGWEHRRLSLAAKELNWSQKQFNDYVNARPENFRLENMSINRSHIDEMPGRDDIERIINNMKKFERESK